MSNIVAYNTTITLGAAIILHGAANISHDAADILRDAADISRDAADICLPKTHFFPFLKIFLSVFDFFNGKNTLFSKNSQNLV